MKGEPRSTRPSVNDGMVRAPVVEVTGAIAPPVRKVIRPGYSENATRWVVHRVIVRANGDG